MIFLTGDVHGEAARFFRNGESCLPLTAGDYLVIAGDFGFLFYPKGSVEYKNQQMKLDEMEKLPYTILWVDGNHENFDLIETYPVEEWNGGCVHRIRKNILHLMRGEVFLIDGVSLFAMGGAYSIDKYMRAEGDSWWRAEQPTDAEYKHAVSNLEKHGKKVDVIVTHTAPKEIVLRMGYHPDNHDIQLTGFLEWIMYEVSYKQWYFGHWHRDEDILPNMHALWFRMEQYQD